MGGTTRNVSTTWHGGSYEQTAHVTGDEEYRAVLPFPVTIAPGRLVTLG